MGREVRMVPPNWEHPMVTRHNGREGPQPMYDRTFAEAASEWKAALAAWERGERPSYADEKDAALEYWEWEGGPPERAYYRTWADNEATWFQVWETVSEGTPVSPPFATKEELVEYLVTNGDFWDQKRGDPPWSRKAAEGFVGTGWAPSMMVVNSGPDAGIYTASTGFPI